MGGLLMKKVRISLREDGGEQEQIEQALKTAVEEIENGYGVVLSIIPTGYFVRHKETMMTDAIIIYNKPPRVSEFGPPRRH